MVRPRALEPTGDGQLPSCARALYDHEACSHDCERNEKLSGDALFSAEHNGLLVKNAKAYYRSLFLEEVSS